MQSGKLAKITMPSLNEFDFQIIHGYKKGTAIKEFIEEVSVDNYKKLKDPHNKGVTMFLRLLCC